VHALHERTPTSLGSPAGFLFHDPGSGIAPRGPRTGAGYLCGDSDCGHVPAAGRADYLAGPPAGEKDTLNGLDTDEHG
jgi:hypothetical protein